MPVRVPVVFSDYPSVMDLLQLPTFCSCNNLHDRSAFFCISVLQKTKKMDQLKTIEEYYGIEFFLRPGLNAEETAELYNTVDIVYDGIGRRRNIFFEDEAEEFFIKYAPKEDTTIECKEMKKMKWMDLEIYNYRFIPNKISFIHKTRKQLDISVEFVPVEIDRNE